MDESSILTMKYPLKRQCTSTAKPGVTLHEAGVFLVLTRKTPPIIVKRRGTLELKSFM